jgi:Tfp pilus assembly protein PilX
MSTTAAERQQGNSQAGMVSIMVTMILMIVLSLIVIGFAQVARRNSRQSLDRQLSTSAFYAAEAGINDVRNLIKTYGAPPAKTDCTNGSGATAAYYGHLPSATLDAATNVEYTCIMVNPNVPTLPYTLGYTGTVVPLTAASGTINTLKFNWQKSSTSSTPTSGCSGNLVAAGSWTCGYAGLRFDLVPTDTPQDIAGYQGRTMSSFVLPVQSGGVTTAAFRSDGGADLIKTQCTNTDCNLTINSGLGGSQYYLRIMSQYYQNVNLQISGTGAGGTPVSFTGAQVLIDATGKAQDVLRRVQVRVPATGTSTNVTSDYAIQSTNSICKRFDIMTNHYQSDAGNAVPGMNNGGNPLCKSP